MAAKNPKRIAIPPRALTTARLVIDIPDRYFVHVRGAEVPQIQVSSRSDDPANGFSERAFSAMGDTIDCVTLIEDRDEQGAIYRVSLDPNTPALHVLQQDGRRPGVVEVHIQVPSFLRTEIELDCNKREPELYTYTGLAIHEMQDVAVTTHPLIQRQACEVFFAGRSSGSITVVASESRVVGAFSFENATRSSYSAIYLPVNSYTLHSVCEFKKAFYSPDTRVECGLRGQINIADDVPDLRHEPSAARAALQDLERMLDDSGRRSKRTRFDYGSLDF